MDALLAFIAFAVLLLIGIATTAVMVIWQRRS